MKTMMSLKELAGEVARVGDAKRDYLADTRRLGFHAVPGVAGLTVDGIDDPFALTDHAAGQVATKLGVPKKFWDRLLTDHPDILQDTVTKLFNREPEERMIRTLDGKARAYVSNRYRRIDNNEIAEQAILPVLSAVPDVEFASCALTETRMHIKAVFPRIEAEVKVGQIVRAGVAIRNSEVGAGAFNVAVLVEVLECTNGMISTQSVSKRHTGSRLTTNGDDGDSSIFSDETLAAGDRALMMEARDLVKAATDEAAFRSIVATCKELADLRVDAAPPRAVEVLGKRHDLSEGEQGSILRHLTEGGDLSAWGYINAVTRTAQEEEISYERATELERLGGLLVELPRQNWTLN